MAGDEDQLLAGMKERELARDLGGEARRFFQTLAHHHQRVDDGVAGDMDRTVVLAFVEQRGAGGLGRREISSGDVVDETAIHLLGIGRVDVAGA